MNKDEQRLPPAVWPFVVACEASVDMTCRQMLMLLVVHHHPGRSTGFVAEQMGVSRPAVTRATDALEALGLVARLPHATDRRCVELYLTKEGGELLRKAGLIPGPVRPAIPLREQKAA